MLTDKISKFLGNILSLAPSEGKTLTNKKTTDRFLIFCSFQTSRSLFPDTAIGIFEKLKNK